VILHPGLPHQHRFRNKSLRGQRFRERRSYTLARHIAFAPVLLLSCLILPGCAVGPNYRRPSVNTPAVFRSASGAAQQASFADQPWWDVFRDETLTELIKTSLANNYGLAAAVARVEQARQIAEQARSQYFPAISYSSVLSYGHNQFTGSPSSNLPGAQGFLLAIARTAWEADLWGRIRRTNEAARAEFFASEDVRRGVVLTLVSDVSQAYFEFLGLRFELGIAQETTQAFAAILKLFTKRLQEGIGNGLQTSRAAADLETAAASVPELERVIALKENQISVLLGKNPGPIKMKIRLLDEPIPPEVPAGLPSSLLEGRPDVLAAAERVRSANAQIGVAQAAFFPTVGLTTAEYSARRPYFRQHKRLEPRSDRLRPYLSGWRAESAEEASHRILATDQSRILEYRAKCFSGSFRCPRVTREI
jgi:outer membrane protein, multidrug efflux system